MLSVLRPETAAELLAVVLCPARAFADRGDAAAAARALLPIKAALIHRFRAACAARARS
jgi:hypothetical protein